MCVIEKSEFPLGHLSRLSFYRRVVTLYWVLYTRCCKVFFQTFCKVIRVLYIIILPTARGHFLIVVIDSSFATSNLNK